MISEFSVVLRIYAIAMPYVALIGFYGNDSVLT